VEAFAIGSKEQKDLCAIEADSDENVIFHCKLQ
jgi:hypothetical protein